MSGEVTDPKEVATAAELVTTAAGSSAASSSSSTKWAATSSTSADGTTPATSSGGADMTGTVAAVATGPQVTFTVKVSGSGPVTVEGPASDTLKASDLKRIIAEKTKMPPEQQKLVFKGKVLSDDDVLADKKVVSGSTVFLVKGVVSTAAASSSSTEAASKPQEAEKAVERTKCLGNCGFWGNPKTESYCSKCFKEKQEKDQAELLKKQEEAEKKEEEAKVKEGEGDKEEEKERPVQENKTRCWICSKKVGLTGIACRCSYVFCAAHRLPEEHSCDFDYKSAGRQILTKLNNKVEADKLGDRA
ncbi:unnamed protein product [Amoebophrya sp. A25]|nr:unnamed protein product [Amoebophrya sp. A25]|eukprot:GSA25T00026724001.1